MFAVALEGALADRHFVKHLRFVFVARDSLAHVANVLEVCLFAFDECGTGIDPDHVAVFVGAQIERTAEIVGACRE